MSISNPMPSEEEKNEHRNSERIAYDRIEGIEIITARREYGGRSHIETMIFGGPLDGLHNLVRTPESAIEEHKHMVASVINELASEEREKISPRPPKLSQSSIPKLSFRR